MAWTLGKWAIWIMGFMVFWIGFGLVAPMIPNGTGDGPAQISTFQDVQDELEERAAARREGRAPVIAPRRVDFNNFNVVNYLLPLLLIKGIVGLARRRQISPFAFLATLWGLWLAAWLVWEIIVFVEPLEHALNWFGPVAIGPLLNLPKLLLLAVLAIVAGLMAILGMFGLLGTAIAWLVYLPRQFDRRLRPRIVLRSRRISGSTEAQATDMPNLLLLGAVGLPSAAALWQLCDVVDGLGGSPFALILRALLLAAAAWWMVKAHNQTYFG